MFDYSLKTKIIAIASLIILLVSLIWLINYNNSRSRDLIMLTQARDLAVSMERYFDKHNKYPEISKTKLVDVKTITENGLNQPGDYLYFQSATWLADGTITSAKDRYIIEFGLNNSWDLWALNNGGGNCRISNYLQMICQSN
jgi:hypothetical protein